VGVSHCQAKHTELAGVQQVLKQNRSSRRAASWNVRLTKVVIEVAQSWRLENGWEKLGNNTFLKKRLVQVLPAARNASLNNPAIICGQLVSTLLDI